MTEQAAYDILIPGTIRNDKRLRFKEQLLYAEIRGLCELEGYCWASNPFLAQRMSVTTRTIRRWLKKLKNCGHIIIEIPEEEKNTRIITLTEAGTGRTEMSGGRTEMSGGRTGLSAKVGQKCPHNNISEYKGDNPKLKDSEIQKREAEAEAEFLKVRGQSG